MIYKDNSMKVIRKSLSVTCTVFKGTKIKWQDQQIIPLNHILVQFVERYFPEHNAKTHESKK